MTNSVGLLFIDEIMLSPRPKHDFPESEVLRKVSSDLLEELLGPLGALLGPEWAPRVP